MAIDESRCYQFPCSLDVQGCTAGRQIADIGNPIAHDRNVRVVVWVARTIDDATVPDDNVRMNVILPDDDALPDSCPALSIRPILLNRQIIHIDTQSRTFGDFDETVDDLESVLNHLPTNRSVPDAELHQIVVGNGGNDLK